MSLYALTIRAIPALGAFIIGQLADLFGLIPSLLGGTILGFIFWMWGRYTIRRNKIVEEIEKLAA
jgi:MFS-type transporter involved in bile tolerance (Atg22 family)